MRDDRKDDEFEPDMPEISGAHHLIDFLWAAGPATVIAGMGASPISHTDLKHFQDNTGYVLTSWEALTLRSLSAAYLDQVQAAKSPGCPSPLAAPELTDDERKDVSDRVQGAFRSLMSAQKGKLGEGRHS